MGKFKNGILGGFSGTVGPVVGYELNGKFIGRSKPRKRRTPPTANELANRAKFKASQVWLQPITYFLRAGFKNYQPNFQGFLGAKSYNSKHAIVGSYPNFQVDPALALVSYGTANQAEIASARIEEPSTLIIEWSGGIFNNAEKAMVLLYDLECERAYIDTAATWRSNQRFELNLKSQTGHTFHIYLAFVDPFIDIQSNSQYLGALKI